MLKTVSPKYSILLLPAYLCNSGISDTPPPLQEDEPPEEAEGGQDEVDASGDEVSYMFCS